MDWSHQQFLTIAVNRDVYFVGSWSYLTLFILGFPGDKRYFLEDVIKNKVLGHAHGRDDLLSRPKIILHCN